MKADIKARGILGARLNSTHVCSSTWGEKDMKANLVWREDPGHANVNSKSVIFSI